MDANKKLCFSWGQWKKWTSYICKKKALEGANKLVGPIRFNNNVNENDGPFCFEKKMLFYRLLKKLTPLDLENN